jgi:hypothetical protein
VPNALSTSRSKVYQFKNFIYGIELTRIKKQNDILIVFQKGCKKLKVQNESLRNIHYFFFYVLYCFKI